MWIRCEITPCKTLQLSHSKTTVTIKKPWCNWFISSTETKAPTTHTLPNTPTRIDSHRTQRIFIPNPHSTNIFSFLLFFSTIFLEKRQNLPHTIHPIFGPYYILPHFSLKKIFWNKLHVQKMKDWKGKKNKTSHKMNWRFFALFFFPFT